MSELADANLVVAALNDQDSLHGRALAHLRTAPPLLVPFSVGIELLLIAPRRNPRYLEALVQVSGLFELERQDVLFAAANLLDSGDVKTVFDAIHVAEAADRGTRLHTADAALLREGFPTVRF